MPAGAIGGCWVEDSWLDTAWEADSWADGVVVHLLPDNIIVATQTVDEIDRTVAVTQIVRRVTFDG